MKKVFFLVLAAAMLFCACTAKDGLAESAQETMQAPSWQAQYDLGVRYLSEGNYEEAIIAFTAAIEIDPKQPDTYKQLAEAYYALGEDEKARDILRQGYEATGDDSLYLEEAESELTEDELAMTEDLWTSLANHDMEQSHSILSSEELVSLIMRVGVTDPDYDDLVSYITLGSPDNGVIIRYDARQSSPTVRCIFGQWEIIGYSVDVGAGYYPQGECVYYEWDDRFEDRTVYVFTVAQFEDGLPNGSCEKNLINSGAEWSSITTTSGETTKGLWNGIVTTREQRFYSDGSSDETGESELVDGIPTLLGYTGTGSTKSPSYSRSLKTGELLMDSEAGAFGYSEGFIPYPYCHMSHSYDGEGDPYEFAASNMRLSVGLPFVWEER